MNICINQLKSNMCNMSNMNANVNSNKNVGSKCKFCFKIIKENFINHMQKCEKKTKYSNRK